MKFLYKIDFIYFNKLEIMNLPPPKLDIDDNVDIHCKDILDELITLDLEKNEIKAYENEEINRLRPMVLEKMTEGA